MELAYAESTPPLIVRVRHPSLLARWSPEPFKDFRQLTGVQRTQTKQSHLDGAPFPKGTSHGLVSLGGSEALGIKFPAAPAFKVLLFLNLIIIFRVK